MTNYLENPPAFYVADLIETYWDTQPPPVAGYEPEWNSQVAGDSFPLSTNWPAGDTYPIITLTNTDPTIPGGGGTNITSIQGNGGGNNQQRLENMLLTVHTETGQTYGSLSAETFAYRLYDRCYNIIDGNSDAPDEDEIWSYYCTPPEGSIPNQSSTQVTHQQQGTVTVNWQKEA